MIIAKSNGEELPPISLMYIAQILKKKHCLFIHTNTPHHQQRWAFQRFESGVMGCRGSEVQILSCRPNNPSKTSLLRLVFLCLFFERGEIGVFRSAQRLTDTAAVSDSEQASCYRTYIRGIALRASAERFSTYQADRFPSGCKCSDAPVERMRCTLSRIGRPG